MKQRSTALDSLWARRSGLISVGVFVVVATLGYILDRFLMFQGLGRSELLLLTNSITGIVAGSFFYSFARQEKAQRALMLERLRTIAELNHHIRNALQVIKFYGAIPGTSPQAPPVQMIHESAHRIEWALREFLPQYPEAAILEVSPLPPGYAAVDSDPARFGAFSEHKAEIH